jgi:hypothetical protein
VARERILDVSGLEAPEPFRAAVAAIHELEEGEYLCMRHRREPFPLYDLLTKLGFSYRMRDGEHARYEILIWRADDPTLTAHCGPAADPTERPVRGCP